MRMTLRVATLQTSAPNRNGLPATVHGALVSGSINAQRHTAGNRQPGLHKGLGKGFGSTSAVRTGVPGTDHGQLRILQQGRMTADKEHQRWVGDFLELGGIARIIQAEQVVIRIGQPVLNHLQASCQFAVTVRQATDRLNGGRAQPERAQTGRGKAP